MKNKYEPHKVAILLDTYGSLLTDKQYDALDLYYNEDLSLAEIADQYDISRQGVRGTLQKGIAQMEEYESKLHVVEKSELLKSALCSVKECLNDERPQDAKCMIDRLLEEEE